MTDTPDAKATLERWRKWREEWEPFQGDAFRETWDALASELARREAVQAFLGLADVLHIRFEHDEIIVVITGDSYDDAQMDRLLERELGFLKSHPEWTLPFHYLPAALAASEEKKP